MLRGSLVKITSRIYCSQKLCTLIFSKLFGKVWVGLHFMKMVTPAELPSVNSLMISTD